MVRARFFLSCLLGAACAATPPLADAGADAGAPEAGLDAGAVDAGVTDAGARDAGLPPRFVLLDGGVIDGLVAARYEHRDWWWTPSEQTTWAVLRPARHAPWPDDGSLVFLSSRALVAQPGALAAVPEPGVTAFLVDAGYVFTRPPLDGVSFVITGHEGYHLHEDGYGDFAWDLVVLGADGLRYTGAGVANADFRVWDQPVYLPTAGVVVEVENGGADNTPGAYDAGAVNNLVGVHLGGGYSLYLLHFRQGSIPTVDAGCAPVVPGVRCVEPGAVLPAGTYLGRAGNSGVSLEPHVHTTLLFYDRDGGRSWSVPSGFTQLYLAAGDGGAALYDFVVPETGDRMSAAPF